MLKLLEELIMIPGISGYETKIREKIAEKVKNFGSLNTDNIGNLLLTLGKGEKHIVFVAHMDEIGCVVSHIEENGIIRIRKISADDRWLSGRIYYICTKKGLIPCVAGIKPPHLISDLDEMKKVIPSEKISIDLGVRSKKDVEKMGIRILDPIVLKKDFTILNNKFICARGLDDRIGCAVLIKVVENITKINLKCKVTFAWSVQEEIGLRGAVVLSHTLKPDVAFAVDTFSTTDFPDSPSHLSPVHLGKGPVLRMIDNRAIASTQIKDIVLKISKESRIPIQLGITGGSTDGASLQESGAQMLPLGIPIRYTHSPTELAHIDDINNLVKLIIRIMERYCK